MKIYVYEYITGGGMRNVALPASLAREGDLMLNALVNDLLTIPGVQVIVSRDDRLEMSNLPDSVELVPVDSVTPHFWNKCSRLADAVWPIAPETDGILLEICQCVTEQGQILLNSRPDAVRLTGSKFQTTALLSKNNIPTVTTYRRNDLPIQVQGEWVIKPDDGVGCEGAQRFKSLESLLDAIEFDWMCDWIIQPWIEGEAISINALFYEGKASLLSCNRQNIKWQDNRPVLSGCTVNARGLPINTLLHIVKRIAACIPGLWGIAGIDLMLTDKGPVVMEINPRLTTSYAGLHRAMDFNPAAMVLEMQATSRLPHILSHSEIKQSVTVDLEINNAA